MHKHIQKEHEGKHNEVTFRWNVIGQFQKPLSRQLYEAICIDKKAEDVNLNSKNEYFRHTTKKITINKDETDQQCDFCGRVLKTMNELVKHEELFHKRIPCSKNNCDYICFGEYDLQQHKQVSHKNNHS